MTRNPHDRRDLEEISKLLFSGAPRDARSPQTMQAPAGRSRLIAIWACGDPQAAAHLATALAAPNSGGPSPRVLAFEIDGLQGLPSLSWSDSRERTRLAALEEEARDLLVLLEGKEGQLARTIALCASEHLLVFDTTTDSRRQLSEVLSCLYEGSAAAPIGIVLPEGAGTGDLGDLLLAGNSSTRRKAEPVGAWRPGLPLPRRLTAFLADDKPPSQSLLWGWDLARNCSGNGRQRPVP